jgi:hypothetical protein
MDTSSHISFASHANAFAGALSLEAVRQRAPAVFAPSAHERMSSKYTFIPTERVLSGLMRAGFVPVDARQTAARRASPIHARHVVRLRRRFETVQLRDSVPELSRARDNSGNHEDSVMPRRRSARWNSSIATYRLLRIIFGPTALPATRSSLPRVSSGVHGERMADRVVRALFVWSPGWPARRGWSYRGWHVRASPG